MESVAQLGAAAAELFEAELRSLKSGVMRMAAALAIGLLILLLALTGVGFLLAALFLALNRAMPPAGSAATVAALTLLIAAGCLFAVWRMVTVRTRAADVVAAKSHVMDLIQHLDLFVSIRRYPWLSIAIATAAGVMLAVSTESLLSAAALTRSITGLVRTAVFALGKFMDETPAQSSKPATSPQTPPPRRAQTPARP